MYDQIRATIPRSLFKAAMRPTLVKYSEAAVSMSGMDMASTLQLIGYVNTPKGKLGRATINCRMLLRLWMSEVHTCAGLRVSHVTRCTDQRHWQLNCMLCLTRMCHMTGLTPLELIVGCDQAPAAQQPAYLGLVGCPARVVQGWQQPSVHHC